MNDARGTAFVTPDSPHWPAAARALTTTRISPGQRPAAGLGGWNLAQHVGDRTGTVAGNRRELQATLGVPRIQWLNQVHGIRCVEASARTAETVPEADAAWTREPGLALAVLTADCVPVVLAHRRESLVGVAHGGWRGLVGGVLEHLVGAMPAQPEDLVAWLGPAIGPRAYEVGDEVADAVARLPGGTCLAEQCLLPGPRGRPYLDLFTLCTRLLQSAGVEQVLTERLCTHSDGRFFSYRRDGRTGRMVTLGWLS